MTSENDAIEQKDTLINIVDNYLRQTDWRVNENSNVNFSLSGLNNYLSGEIVKNYWLRAIYPDEIGKKHADGDYHIHDLSGLCVYCCGHDLAQLLTVGFGGVPYKCESGPAKHFRTALLQIVNFIFTLQNEASGAQAFSNFDTYLAPFIREDGLSYKEVRQSLQEFVYNMNISTRQGGQCPFSNVTLDFQCPAHMKDEAVIIGGVRSDEHTYGEYQEEMNMFNKAFLSVMTEGDSKGRVFSFPVITVNIDKDFDWENPRYMPLWENTAKYGLTYFCNFINSDMKPEDSRSLCCRLRLSLKEIKKRGGGLFGAAAKTGSIGVVTINLPRIGYKAKTEEDFFKMLDGLMDDASQSLEIKRKVIEKYCDDNLYPYTKFYLQDVKQRLGGYFANHFSTIGFVGLNECCLNFLGKGLVTKEGHDFGVKVLDYMNAKILELQEKTKQLYNLEATPAEGTSYRLAKKDKELFGDSIIVANQKHAKEGAAPYYTNSCQLPVDSGLDVFSMLENQNDLQTKMSGGTVVHLFIGEKIKNPVVAREFVKKVLTNYNMPYISLTPTFSVCPEHGYIAGEEPVCPTCGKETEVYSRIVGYLRSVKNWNVGKKEEFKDRKTLKINSYVLKKANEESEQKISENTQNAA